MSSLSAKTWKGKKYIYKINLKWQEIHTSSGHASRFKCYMHPAVCPMLISLITESFYNNKCRAYLSRTFTIFKITAVKSFVFFLLENVTTTVCILKCCLVADGCEASWFIIRSGDTVVCGVQEWCVAALFIMNYDKLSCRQPCERENEFWVMY